MSRIILTLLQFIRNSKGQHFWYLIFRSNTTFVTSNVLFVFRRCYQQIILSNSRSCWHCGKLTFIRGNCLHHLALLMCSLFKFIQSALTVNILPIIKFSGNATEAEPAHVFFSVYFCSGCDG